MEFIKRNKFLVLLLVLASLCLFFSTGHIANIFNDIGREIYYPVEILKGKVLYKDLFCIYGPFSYLLNALFYKIFGANLNTLYFAGVTSALSIVAFIYLISKKFLGEFESFSITAFVIITGCLATRIFNFTLPYSYAALYGLVSFLVSVYFLTSYIENKKNINLYIASFFGGISICSKYDFFLYAIPLFFVFFTSENKKTSIKACIAFFAAIFIPFLILFLQGLKIPDLVSAYQTIKAFAVSDSLRTFYLTQGVYYTGRIWSFWFFKLAINALGLTFMYFALLLFSKNEIFKKISGLIIAFVTAFCFYSFSDVANYLFLTFLTVVLFLFRFKKNTFAENIFIFSVILISLKSLWGISHANYGIYYIGAVLISFFILIKNNTNKIFTTALAFVILSLASNYFVTNSIWIKSANEKIKTNHGMLYTLKDWGRATNELTEFINGFEEENPKIVVFPEGLTINFLVDKKNETEDYYNSLIPLYVESFGEENIIEYYKQNMPDYIIFSSLDNSSYGADKSTICVDYAVGFCKFVSENYNLIKTAEVNEKTSFVVLKKK